MKHRKTTQVNRGIFISICGFLATMVLYVVAACFLQSVAVPSVIAGGYFSRAVPVKKTLCEQAPQNLLVLDAGHGGDDAGCVQGDVLEKDLNLSVTQRLSTFLTLCGVPHCCTRERDMALCGEDVKGERRRTDLTNRLRLAQEQPQAIFLSIHMNRFADPRYHGLQVFYSPNADSSREFAQTVQHACTTYLDGENNRRVKKAGSNIFLLYKLQGTAVLVECGFLSNPQECTLLQTDTYQQQLALLLGSAALEYLRQVG